MGKRAAGIVTWSKWQLPVPCSLQASVSAGAGIGFLFHHAAANRVPGAWTQVNRWAARWLVQTGVWGEWAVLAVKAGSEHTTWQKALLQRKTACKFIWSTGGTSLLKGNTSSMHLSGHIVSTVSGSWEQSLLKQPGGWTVLGESFIKQAMHRPYWEGSLCGCHLLQRTEWSPNSFPLLIHNELGAGWSHSLGFSWWDRSKSSLVGIFVQQELCDYARCGFGPLCILEGGSRMAVA